MRGKSDHRIGLRRELAATEEFYAGFPVAAIPMALTDDISQHVSVGKTEQSEIMHLPTAEGLDAKSHGCLNGKCLRRRLKSIANVPLPNSGRLRSERLGLPWR